MNRHGGVTCRRATLFPLGAQQAPGLFVHASMVPPTVRCRLLTASAMSGSARHIVIGGRQCFGAN